MGRRWIAFRMLMSVVLICASETVASFQAFAAAADTSPPASSADAILKRGYSALETGDIDGAVADLDHAIQRNPDLATAYLYRGVAHFAQGDDATAITDLREAEGKNPDLGAAKTIREFIQLAVKTEGADIRLGPLGGDAPSKAVGRTHECIEYFTIFSILMAKTGTVLVRYDVTETGAIANATVANSSGDTWMDRAAVLCVSRHFRNTPAVQNGVAVASPGHTTQLSYVTP